MRASLPHLRHIVHYAAGEEVAEGVEREARDVDVGEEEGVEGEEDGNLKGNRATIKRKDIYFLGEVFK